MKKIREINTKRKKKRKTKVRKSKNYRLKEEIKQKEGKTKEK